jgi:soluble cytochrome b562
MLRSILLASISACIFISGASLAVVPDEDSAVSRNFKAIGRELRSFGQISDQNEMVEMLEMFHAKLNANRKEVPSFMEAGTEQYAEFQDGIDEVLGKVDAALALARSGDLEGAKDIVSGFRDMRKKYHEHFEIEDD